MENSYVYYLYKLLYSLQGPFYGYELARILTRSLYLPEKEKEHKLASEYHTIIHLLSLY
jgi:hypothetical protein